MKKIVSLIAFTLAVASSASALDPVNCLQWELTTESEFVTRADADRATQDILEGGKTFGLFLEETEFPQGFRNYRFRYNRDSVIDNPSTKEIYESAMRNVYWHLNSRMGYNFHCSFEADGPQPRISGSN